MAKKKKGERANADVDSLLTDPGGTVVAARKVRKPRSAPELSYTGVDEEEEFRKGVASLAADEEDETPRPPKGKKKKAKLFAEATATVPDLVSTRHLDHRKLSRKAREKLTASWKGANRGKTLDSFFRRQTDEARRQFGHQAVYLGSESEALVVCIPCPSLAFEFVIAQNGFPLGLVLQIVAKHGIGKSGLLAEIMRWFNKAGGGGVLCENETKFNPHWYKSILGQEMYDRMPLYRCTSVEDWQRKLTWAVGKMKRDLEGTPDDPGPGRSVPVVFGVDSIMGKMSEENQEKILGKKGKKGERGTTGAGFAQARSFPIEAGSITKYMRTIPQEMDEWPFSLVLINHLRVKQDDMGNQERNKTGGEQVNFQESFELELKKIGGHKKRIECADYEGVPISISCEKNSFGPTHRQIQTRLLWWDEKHPETGKYVQKTVWDWDWSTVHMLNSLMRGEKSSPRIKAKLADIGFHLECPTSSDIENSAWSKTLGMKASDATQWTEVGAMIREDKKLLDNLRDCLGITRRPLLAGDYLSQIDELASEMP